ITALLAPFAPALASRLDGIGTNPGPAHLKLTLDVNKNSQKADRASARAVLDFVAPQLNGLATLTATPEVAALRRIDLAALRRSEFSFESKRSEERRVGKAWKAVGREE